MLNFIKTGIFSRQTGEPAPEPESKNQVLAVWGSPGSGKTTVSVKLAKHLADQKKNVALLLCDMTAPMLPCICPPSDLECERIPKDSAKLKSLGSILAATHVTDSLIQNNCVVHKKISHLTLLGMRKGENEYTYPPYSAAQASELIDHLRDIAPYVVIDCGSYIANDILSAVSLMEADSVLRLVNCDLKSISYLSSQLPLLKDNKWDADKQCKAASNVKSSEASEHVEQVLGSVAFQIPHSDELSNQALAGDLFKDLCLKDSRGFRKEIKKISMEVFGL
jgi:MinD-like ATPase involved in chromosome partitioning or flagellar assembly